MKISVLFGTVLRTNNYLITSDDASILIEASCSLDELKSELNGKKLDAILLTHAHWDHYSNLQKISDFHGCSVYLTREALEKIKSPARAFATDRKPKIDCEKVDFKIIRDGDVLEFGKLELKVVSTPGHTNCSVCYFLEKENQNLLFSGDTVFEQDLGRTDLPTGNEKELLQSIEKILKLNDKTVIFPGHGPTTDLSLEREFLEEIIRKN